MSEPAYVAETLAWCNERRAEQGKRPLKRLPKGRRREGRSCPCGKATQLDVQVYLFWTLDNVLCGTLPQAVSDFVVAFDAGELPEYEAT